MIVEQRASVVGALQDALSRLEDVLVQEGKGRQAEVFLRETVRRQGGRVTPERLLQEVKREIAEVDLGWRTDQSW